MMHCIVSKKLTNVLKVLTASIIRVMNRLHAKKEGCGKGRQPRQVSLR
jgi:hypothetical protein